VLGLVEDDDATPAQTVDWLLKHQPLERKS
jgi:hypothetical protein